MSLPSLYIYISTIAISPTARFIFQQILQTILLLSNFKMMLPKPSSCVSSPKVRDKRWQNFDPLPVAVLLFFFAAVLIGLSGGELFLGSSVFPYVPSPTEAYEWQFSRSNLH